MLRAIPFGVFVVWPSTIAIIRGERHRLDRQMRTTIQSDSTRVPPVTARGAVGSGITGALHP
jgi:hypothetical protein